MFKPAPAPLPKKADSDSEDEKPHKPASQVTKVGLPGLVAPPQPNVKPAATKSPSSDDDDDEATTTTTTAKKAGASAPAAAVPKFIAKAHVKRPIAQDSDSDEGALPRQAKPLAVKPQLRPAPKFSADSSDEERAKVMRPSYTSASAKRPAAKARPAESDSSDSDADDAKKKAKAPAARKAFDPSLGANHHNRFRQEKSLGTKAFADDDDDFSAPVVKKTLTKGSDVFK